MNTAILMWNSAISSYTMPRFKEAMGYYAEQFRYGYIKLNSLGPADTAGKCSPKMSQTVSKPCGSITYTLILDSTTGLLPPPTFAT